MKFISYMMQELLYLYGFVVDNNPDDYLMVIPLYSQISIFTFLFYSLHQSISP